MPNDNIRKSGEELRISFARIPAVREYPDFLNVQLKSWEDFVQAESPSEDREDLGLQTVFQEHFPIQDSRERYMLEFLNYTLDAPKHSVSECIAQGLTFSIPLKAKLRLSRKEDEDEDEANEAVEMELKEKFSDVMGDSVMVEIFNAASKLLMKDIPKKKNAKKSSRP